MQNKPDYYSILGISRGASNAEIDAAYERLMRQFESGEHGPDTMQHDHRINLLNQAYRALSDKSRRASYDRSLDGSPPPFQLSVAIQEPRWTSPRAILNIVGRLIVMGLMIQVGFMLVNLYLASQANNAPDASKDERIIEGYDAINGKLSPEQLKTGKELAEEQRREAEADQRRREQEDAMRRQEWELERDRQYANEVSSDLRSAEEQARQKTEKEQRRQEVLEQEKQERERERIERLQEKWRNDANRQMGNGNEE